MSTTTKTIDNKPAKTKTAKTKSYKFEEIEYTKDLRESELHLVAKQGLFTEALVKHKMLKKYNEVEAFKMQWAEHSLGQVEKFMAEEVAEPATESVYVHQEDLHESSLIAVKKDEDGEFYVTYVEEVHKRNLQTPLGGLAACTVTWVGDDEESEKTEGDK